MRRIGKGCAAEVYLATDNHGRAVALKIIRRSGAQAELVRQRFSVECATLAGIDHEHVVRALDYAAGGDVGYLAMEYLGGGTLRDAMRAGLNEAQALSILLQAASGLAAVHRRAIVHCDIKPENCLFRAGGELVLADFGLALPLAHAHAHAVAGRGSLGTPCYAAPEQTQGGVPTPACDIYSLGVVFYEMLRGQRPFPGETEMELQAQHLMAPVPRLPEGLSRYQTLVDGMLEKQPHRRIADGSALLQEIRRAQRVPRQEKSSIHRAEQPLPC